MLFWGLSYIFLLHIFITHRKIPSYFFIFWLKLKLKQMHRDYIKERGQQHHEYTDSICIHNVMGLFFLYFNSLYRMLILILTSRGRAFRFCDPSKKMHQKGILYHRLIMGKVSIMGRSSIPSFPPLRGNTNDTFFHFEKIKLFDFKLNGTNEKKFP